MPETHRRAVSTGSASTEPRSPGAPPASSHLKIDSTHQGETCIVKLRGELDLSNAPKAEAEVLAALMDGHRLVVVDLGELAFIDSSGISALLRLEARSRPDPGRLVFLRGSGQVQRVLSVCGVDGLFKFLD
jgi:anti-sigma B factor antagonist